MRLTYKYRLNPTTKQRHVLNDIFFQMQTVYNDALNERRWYWDRSRKSISYFDQWPRMRDERKSSPDEMGLLNAASIQQMLRRLDKGYKAFYSGQRGLPRFKGRHRFKSVEHRHGDGSKVKGNRLYIQHVGDIRIRLHRPIPADATVKHVVLKRTRGNFDVVLMLELPDPEPAPHPGPPVGIDVGLYHLLALSDGTIIDNPRWLRLSLAELRVWQRKMSRRKRFSRGWDEARNHVTRLHEKIGNQRRDFWHKLTTELARTYGVIVIEDLNLAFMLRNHKLSLSAHDAAIGMMRPMLTYKVEKTGTLLIAENPKGTSQECSGCSEVVSKGLAVRTHICPSCGLVIDRDVNAGLNLLKRAGLAREALTYPVAVRSSPAFAGRACHRIKILTPELP